MKHYLIITIITALSCTPINTMYHDIIHVKLNDGTQQTIDKNISYKSNTIHKKQRWKKRLSISPDLPIVLHNVSPHALQLFRNACANSTDTFMADFFNKLSENDQKQLTSVAGKTHLDSPEITLLLTQQLPTDICNTIAANFEKNKDKVIHYLQCAMIKNNIAKRPILKLNTHQYPPLTTTLHHDDGTLSHIPIFFSSEHNLCTHNAPYKIAAIKNKITTTALNDNNEKIILSPKKKFVHYAGKTINNCEYLVTSTLASDTSLSHSTSFFLWKITIDQQNTHDPLIIYKRFNNHPVKKVTWSPNGKFIAISNKLNNNQLLLLEIDPSAIITTKEQYIKTSGQTCCDIMFNHSSTAFAATVRDQHAPTSELVIYDTYGKIISTTSFSGECRSLSFNHDDSRLIGMVTLSNGYSKLYIWDTTTLTHPTEITSDLCHAKNLELTLVHYSPYSINTAIGHMQNGNLLLIKELPNHIIHTTQLNHEAKNTYDLQDHLICSLFSPNGKFIFHHTNYLELETQDIANLPILTSYVRHAKLMVWDIHTKQLIAEYKTNDPINAKQPQIALATDECRLITNHERQSWLLHQLYTQDEQATTNYIHACHNLFELYALRQLYRAHKQQYTINLDSNDLLSTIVDNLPDKPYTIKQCIRNYLIYKQSNGLWTKAVEFVHNFWK